MTNTKVSAPVRSRYTKTRAALSLCGVIALASCGLAESKQAGNFAQDAYVLLLGNSKSEILRCAGQPESITNTALNGVKVERWHYVYPWSKHEPTDVYYEGYLDIFFQGDEVIEIKPSANRTTNSIGASLLDTTIATMSEPVIRNCVQ